MKMETIELKSYEELINYIEENNAKIIIDKNENISIHLDK
jgi:effector-binding domain-containing protein